MSTNVFTRLTSECIPPKLECAICAGNSRRHLLQTFEGASAYKISLHRNQKALRTLYMKLIFNKTPVKPKLTDQSLG